tara:strand:- start:11947 stop:12651 length:705 start_codon:yes stop_codon:yes gene_type:complete
MNENQCATCGSRNKSVFCHLVDADLKQIDAKKVCNFYEKGQHLFVQDTPVNGVFCVSSGKIKLVQTDPNGKETILRIAKGGDVLGHRSMLAHSNYRATATALEKVEVCFIDKKYFSEVISSKPSVSLELLEKLSDSLGDSERRLTAFTKESVKERVAGFLLYLNRSFGKEDPTGRRYLDIKLTREEMASMVGTAPETMIRTLSQLKKDGMISQEGKRMFIENVDELLDLSGIGD